MNLDRHGFGFLSLGFGYVNAQHAVFGFGMIAIGIRAIRQNEATRECAVNAFDADCVFALVFAFQFAFAADGDDAVRDEISCRIGDIDAGRRQDLDLHHHRHLPAAAYALWAIRWRKTASNDGSSRMPS